MAILPVIPELATDRQRGMLRHAVKEMAYVQLELGGMAEGENEEWASRRTRLVIWCIVALLVIVAVLFIVWVLRLEGVESTLR